MAERVPSIDRLRGLIMALMALDHTRDFFFGLAPSPTDLAETTPALFATRWITHVCAPGFLLLAGMSARLLSQRSGRRHVCGFLLLRGAVLIALALTIIPFGWIPDPGRGIVLLQVIWAIGWSMILLAALVRLPAIIVGVIAISTMILPLAAPAAPAAPAALHGAPEWLIVLLFDGGDVLSLGDTEYIVSYAILPWAAVMAFGWWAGGVFVSGGRLRTSAGIWTGLALILAFAATRVLGFGDPEMWIPQGSTSGTVTAFLNVEKYPPSPAYLALTLGLVFLLLGIFSRGTTGRVPVWLEALGRAPLFFYVLHLYVLRSIGLAAAAFVWGADQLGPPPQPSTPEVALWATWLIWLAAMVALTPPTGWFGELKARSGSRLLKLL